jgi:hypothetical protein
MRESYIEGRFGIVMEEIRDSLVGIENQLIQINERLGGFENVKKPKLAKVKGASASETKKK